jgi:hypothetical protein
MEDCEGRSLHIKVNTVLYSNIYRRISLTLVRGMLLHCFNSTCMQLSWVIVEYFQPNTVTSMCPCPADLKIPYLQMKKLIIIIHIFCIPVLLLILKFCNDLDTVWRYSTL